MKFKESKSIYLQIADRIMDEILRMVYPEEGICRNGRGQCQYGCPFL